MDIRNNLITWLASGERGISSDTIVQHLTGITCLKRPWHASHPHDPDDLTRCRMLLEQVPELAAEFPRMKDASPSWHALVTHWQELCDMMDAEAPQWRDRNGRCPKTYARMSELIDPEKNIVNKLYCPDCAIELMEHEAGPCLNKWVACVLSPETVHLTIWRRYSQRTDAAFDLMEKVWEMDPSATIGRENINLKPTQWGHVLSVEGDTFPLRVCRAVIWLASFEKTRNR